MNTTSNTVYPDFGIYSSEGIPLYNLGVSPHLIANGAVTSAQNSYPYQTYQTPSGLYLTTNPASLAASQLIPQFQTSTGAAGPHGSATYPLLATPYRLPLAQNVNQMNSYIHMSNATTPPLSQTSSVPIQVHTSVANSMMGSDGSHAANNAAMNAINNGMSSLNFLQSPVYAISPNMPNSGQSMACVQNVQLKTDNRPDMSAENGSMMSPNPTHILELMPMWTQNVPNMQSSQQKMAPNRYIQYSSTAKPHPNQNTPQNTSAPAKDRPDRRNNSSFNNSHHYRKSATGSVGYHRLSNKAGNGGAGGGHTGYGSAQNSYQNHTNYANNSYENECQMVHNNSLPNALQGLPFVKHNNRLHTVPFNHQPMFNVVQQHHHSLANGTGGGIGGSTTGGVGSGGQPPMIPKLVNGVPIYTFAANSAGGGGGYGSPLTPPLTPGTHQMVHK
ncbi:unnamed protein product [Medioppia subpectinata]|uniref:Uncharacterized protein n=1 Tax=Medioppia subpectinata TaxID=1979941 RepID=A0A7R9KX05_9ACAR|nr:unnamed protein product [Medioppia subpectinata]CAG2111367.1 unnamed protein product [Medioppia subpectinata]